jgi:phage gp46-like protein
VHTVGDNASVTRQHSRRSPPRTASLKRSYWTARRTADAVGVRSWMLHPRERNSTVQATIKAVQLYNHGMEWSSTEECRQAGQWDAILAHTAADVRYWIAEGEELASGQGMETHSTV